MEEIVNPTLARIKAIQKCVAEYYGLTVDELLCADTKRIYSIPRSISVYLCRELYLIDISIIMFHHKRERSVYYHCSMVADNLFYTDKKSKDDMKVLKEMVRRKVTLCEEAYNEILLSVEKKRSA